MIAQAHCNQTPSGGAPEARYAYYRRCQVCRRNGEQCRAPAEKGADICYAHACQQATAQRRKRELTAVLAEATEKMRARGKAEFSVADIFTDFSAIQVTIAVMAQALIDGRIDCKTAGRLAVGLQTASKLQWMMHRNGGAGRKGKQIQPRIGAGERDRTKAGSTAGSVEADGTRIMAAGTAKGAAVVAIRGLTSPRIGTQQATGPPEWLLAA